jgi:NTP pyrophosphatase (non-canonical NTP hydrolase)
LTLAEQITEAAAGIGYATEVCYGAAKAAGWHRNEPYDERDKAVQLCLIHSEISEALEGVRKDKMDDHLPHRKAEEVELADALIRIFDFAGAHGLDLGGAFVEKLAYNQRRADHRPEARAAEGGKKF